MTSSDATENPGKPTRQLLPARAREIFYGDDPRPVALAYLLLLTLAEVLTVLVVVQVGVFLHLSLLLLLMVHTAAVWERPVHRLLLSLSLVPLIRVISLTLPLVGLPLVLWYFVVSAPLFGAALVAMNLLGFSWRELVLCPAGLKWHGWLLQIGVGLTGLGLGYVEYLILRPDPLVDELTLAQFWLPALILLASTGYLEELIYRGIMQRTAVERLGARWGIIYVAIFFAVLHIGYKSLVDVIFVLAVGLAFGFIVHRTRHLLGVALAHGLTNIALFLLLPFWIGGSETLQLPPAQLPPTVQVEPILLAGSTPVSSLTYTQTPSPTPPLRSTRTARPLAPSPLTNARPERPSTWGRFSGSRSRPPVALSGQATKKASWLRHDAYCFSVYQALTGELRLP